MGVGETMKQNFIKRWIEKDSASVYYLLIGPPFIILFLLTAGPLVMSLVMSLLDWNLAKPNSIQFIGLDNFISMVNDKNFWKAVGLTIYQVGATVIGQLVIGMGIALLLTRK